MSNYNAETVAVEASVQVHIVPACTLEPAPLLESQELTDVAVEESVSTDLLILTPDVVEVPPYPVKAIFRYIANVHEANNALRHIVRAQVGFDTEQTSPGSEAAATFELQYGKRHPESHSGDGVRWSEAKLCIVQIAIPGYVYILDVKCMRAFPEQLRRILLSEDIPKVGCGLVNDGKIIAEEIGLDVKRFVDVGLMIKFADAELYSEEDSSGLSLERCVKDVLGYKLDKSLTATQKWDEGLTPQKIDYAGLDAQSSLEVYMQGLQRVVDKENVIGRLISRNWYTFDFEKGKPVCTQRSTRGEALPWANNLCPWYRRGKFQGYF